MSGLWDIRDKGCLRFGMLKVWDFSNVECSECGMFVMYDRRDGHGHRESGNVIFLICHIIS